MWSHCCRVVSLWVYGDRKVVLWGSKGLYPRFSLHVRNVESCSFIPVRGSMWRLRSDTGACSSLYLGKANSLSRYWRKLIWRQCRIDVSCKVCSRGQERATLKWTWVVLLAWLIRSWNGLGLKLWKNYRGLKFIFQSSYMSIGKAFEKGG